MGGRDSVLFIWGVFFVLFIYLLGTWACPACSIYPVYLWRNGVIYADLSSLPLKFLYHLFYLRVFFFLLPGILDTAIIDRGKNVLSGSRDGTARLWDCGRSACLGVIADCGSSINGVAVGAADNSINLGCPEQVPSELIMIYELFCFLRPLQY